MSNDIYTHIETNFNIKITNYTFKRDYITEPLKAGERPFKEDLEYLYITLNLPGDDIFNKIFNVSKRTFFNWTTFYQIKKPSNLQWELSKKTQILKYDKLFSQTNIWLEKCKETSQNNWGTDNPSQSPIIKKRVKKTNLLKYNAIHPMCLKEFQEKAKFTNNIKYHNDFPLQNQEILNKMFKTNMDRYNCKSTLQLPGIKEQISKTNLERYGAENYFKSEESRLRYNEYAEKSYYTKKKNNSFFSNTSRVEQEIYSILLSKFPNAINQYRDNERYPFNCDFYIPELDLFIEYQGYIGHWKEPFDETNENHISIIDKWKERAEEINFKGKKKLKYLSMIKTWTKKDPLKREIAKKNGLNWLEFFNKNEFMKWFDKQ